MAEEIHRTTLDNGLEVVAQHISGVTGAAIAVNYRVGFRTEPRDRSGFAHLFEHMMFQGSLNVPGGDHFARIQAHGGFVNGNTFQDVTDYHQVVPVGVLAEVLALEADRMAHLSVTERNFTTQRDVVKEEIRQQVTARPYGGFPWTTLPAVLYRRWENAHNGYGETADLDAATVADCADFYAHGYGPGNAVLAICGQADPHTALDAARRAFAAVPARTRTTPPDLGEPLADTPLHGTVRDPLAPRPALALGCRLPDPAADLDAYAAFLVLSKLLTGGSNARLRRALAPLHAQVDSSVGFFGPLMARDPDTFLIVSHHPDGQAEAVLEAVTGQCADLAAGGCPPQEAERAVAAALTDHHQQLDSLLHRARFLARGTLLFDRPGIVDDLAAALTAVTPRAIGAAAATVARPAGRALVTLLPGKAA
ncbi:M16 family metallopeptidase [Kitasatospora sp. NPDC089509]|uniref:M16 family metallopeptidase n=1 Tax=Kitasatospora sp. NPDC089509 TaxID=3364079 RepID=UPI003807130B